MSMNRAEVACDAHVVALSSHVPNLLPTFVFTYDWWHVFQTRVSKTALDAGRRVLAGREKYRVVATFVRS